MQGVTAKTRLTQENLDTYNKDGFVIIPGFLKERELAPLRQACEADPTLGKTQTYVDYGKSGFYKISVWSQLGDSFLGVLPRLSRIVDAAEFLEGEECYHWHSKIVLKKPGEGTVAWHQGFGAWYEDYCLYPKMTTFCLAINEHTRENGCLQIAKGSHLLGRIENTMLADSNTCGADPERLKVIFDRFEIVHCEMKPGDALFFHANTLHGSDVNVSDDMRIALFTTYNAIKNEPYNLEGQQHHRYIPLKKMPDSALIEGKYNGIFETQEFFPVEAEGKPGVAINVRRHISPTASSDAEVIMPEEN